MVKPTRPHYNTAEIRDLYNKLKGSNNLEPEVQDTLDGYIAYEDIPEEKRTEFSCDFEAFQSIAGDAYALEVQAKQLRRIVKTFRCPLNDLGRLINDENETVKQIAIWRLSLGR